jgi:hypothetical protein
MACYPWAHRTKIVFRTVSATELPGNLKSLPQLPLSLSFPLWPIDSIEADDGYHTLSCYAEDWVTDFRIHAIRANKASGVRLHPTLTQAHVGSVIPQLGRIVIPGRRVSYLGFSVAVRLQSHDTPGFAVMRRTLRRRLLRRM